MEYLPLDDLKIISHHLIKYNINPQKIKIVDYTAGVGGNVLSFCKYFKEVVGIEKDTSRYNLLALNLSSYQFNNLKLYNNSCLEFLDNEYDVIFFDPPWGGYQYKKHKELKKGLSPFKSCIPIQGAI